MGDFDRLLPAGTIEWMGRITVGEPIKQYTPATEGTLPVFHIETTGGEQYVLKTAGTGEPIGSSSQAYSIRVEARLLAALGSYTSIPVPSIAGVVDGMPDFESPFFAMEAIEGATIGPEALDQLDNSVLDMIAYQIGDHIAKIHALPIELTKFGYLGYDDMDLLAGEVPDIELEQFSVRDGYQTWPDSFKDWLTTDLTRFEYTPLAALLPDVETALNEYMTALPVDPQPVIGRVHQSIDNVLFDQASGEVQALIDWEPRHVVCPAFDLAVVEYSLSGGAWRSLPDIEDRLDLVHDALCAGYTNTQPLPNKYRDQRKCYHLAQLVLSVNRLSEGQHPLSDRELLNWFRTQIMNMLP